MLREEPPPSKPIAPAVPERTSMVSTYSHMDPQKLMALNTGFDNEFLVALSTLYNQNVHSSMYQEMLIMLQQSGISNVEEARNAVENIQVHIFAEKGTLIANLFVRALTTNHRLYLAIGYKKDIIPIISKLKDYQPVMPDKQVQETF